MAKKQRAVPAGAALLDKWMRRQGFALADVAVLLHVGEPYISHLRKGRRRLSLTKAMELEKASSGYVPASAWAA